MAEERNSLHKGEAEVHMWLFGFLHSAPSVIHNGLANWRRHTTHSSFSKSCPGKRETSAGHTGPHHQIGFPGPVIIVSGTPATLGTSGFCMQMGSQWATISHHAIMSLDQSNGLNFLMLM